MPASESYPEDLLYNAEHDWARVDGDEAVLGITLVRRRLARRARPLRAAGCRLDRRKGRSYGEVESVKAVSDLISPLSGEVLEVNAARDRCARDRERRPVRRGLADPDSSRRAGRARGVARRRGVPQGARRLVSYISLTSRGPRADARGDRRRLDRRALPRHPGRRALRPRSRRAAGARRGRPHSTPRAARGEERARRRLVSRRGHVRPLRSGGRRRGLATW